MRVAARITLASLPLLLCLAGWHGSSLVNEMLGCTALGKYPLPCIFVGLNIQPVLAFAWWYGMLLWVPALVISGVLLATAVTPLFSAPFGTKP